MIKDGVQINFEPQEYYDLLKELNKLLHLWKGGAHPDDNSSSYFPIITELVERGQ